MSYRTINLIGQMPDGGSRRNQSQITKIAIHYSGTKSGNAKAFANHHINTLKWRTSGYHEIVAINGDLELCYNPTTITNGVGGNNSYTYHISYVGDGQPTSAQLNTLTERVLYNLNRLKLKYTDVLGHREFPRQSTACPALDMTSFRIRVRDEMNKPKVSASSTLNASVQFEDKSITGFVENGVTYVQLRELANLLNLQIGYSNRQVTFNNKVVNPRVIEGRSFLPVRVVAEELGLRVGWNQASRKVTLSR